MAGAVQPQSFVDTTLKFFKTKIANTAKIPMYTIDWLKIAGVIEADSERATRIRGTASTIKLGADVIVELPKKAVVIGEKLEVFVKAPSLDNGKELFFAGNAIINPLNDAAELAQNRGIINLPEERFKLFQQINGISMLFHWGRTILTCKEKYLAAERFVPVGAEQIHNREVKLRKEMFECLKAISYFVLGVFIVSSLILGVAVPGIFFTAAVTSALVFTILNFYNENWGHPPLADEYEWIPIGAV